MDKRWYKYKPSVKNKSSRYLPLRYFQPSLPLTTHRKKKPSPSKRFSTIGKHLTDQYYYVQVDCTMTSSFYTITKISSLSAERLCVLPITTTSHISQVPPLEVLYRDQQKWIIPFDHTNLQKTAYVQVELDGHPVQCCVDTGSTRLAISSTLMKDIFGPTYSRKLRQYPLGKVSDAQGKQIHVLGFYYGTLVFPDKMTVRGHIMVSIVLLLICF